VRTVLKKYLFHFVLFFWCLSSVLFGNVKAQTETDVDTQPEQGTKCSDLARERELLLHTIKRLEREAIGVDHTRLRGDAFLINSRRNKMTLRLGHIRKEMKKLNCPSENE